MGKKTFNRANPALKQFEVYDDFSGGLNTEQSDNAIRDNTFRKIINFDIDKAGSLVKRPGLYSIPYVKELMNNKINEVINNREILDGGNPVSLETLKVNDVVQFFDGKHWVFNYITTWGLFTLCLDSNMRLPIDLDAGETLLNTYVKFYPDKKDLQEPINFKTKISKYNDIYVMIKSFFSKAETTEDDKKQVKLYSWNPIKKVIDGIKQIPSWIEASEEQDDTKLKKWNDYGNNETVYITSNKINTIVDNVNSFFQLESIKPLSPEIAGMDTTVPYKVYLKEEALSTSIVKNFNGQESSIRLTKKDGSSIIPSDIAQVCLKNKDTLLIYLNSVDYKDNEYNGVIEVNLSNNNFNYKEITPTFGATYQKRNTNVNPNTFSHLFQSSQFDFGGKYDRLITFNKISVVSRKGGKNRAQKIIHTSYGCPMFWDFTFSPKERWSQDYQRYEHNDMIWGENDNWPNGSDAGEPNGNITNVLQETSGGNFKCVGYGGVKTYSTIESSGPPYYALQVNHPNGWDFALTTIDNYSSTSFEEWKNNRYEISYDLKNYNIKSFSNRKLMVKYTVRFGDLHRLITCNTDYDRTFENAMLDENTFAFANSTWEVKYKDTKDGPIRVSKIKSAFVDTDTFNFSNVTKYNAPSLLRKNNVAFDNIDWINPEDLFGVGSKEKFKAALQNFTLGRVTDISFVGIYTVDNQSKSLITELKKYEYLDFLQEIVKDKSLGISVFKVDNKVQEVTLHWKNNGVNQKLIEISVNSIDNFESIKQQLFNTLYFSLNYEYLPDGYTGQVLTFKQQKYYKPNLNDLTNLWYNLLLMSSFNSKTYPDIYDNKIHPYISSKLVDYPRTNDTGNRPIALFGIVPVNDVILQSGEQNFQLFYYAGTDRDIKTNIDKLIIAITTMSVDDYTAMINSEDYSTTGFSGSSTGSDEQKKVIGPKWETFTSKLSKFDDDQDINSFKQKTQNNGGKGKPAIFNVKIPNSTSAYMLAVQVAEKDDKQIQGQVVPKLATVSETRIQFQPNTSPIKENFAGLFDEFTTTTNLTTYSSHLVAYGNSNKLFFSDIATPSYFPLSRIIMLETPEAIQSATIFQNKLIVSTSNNRFYIGGSSFDSSTDPFSLKVVSTDSGIFAKKSEVAMGNYLYFLDSSGIKILKNLYGTADKEFSYETIDTPIKSMVPRDVYACGVAYRDKYHICFPQYNMILVYNFNYKCWVSYESKYFNFSNMFVNDDKLYGVDRFDFTIYEFRDDVFVDNWNETYGFEDITQNGTKLKVQKGEPIECYLETKSLDQAYVPHRKKYDYALINANISGVNVLDENNNTVKYSGTGNIVPYIKVDNDEINYNFEIYKDDSNTYFYKETNPNSIMLLDNSVLSETLIVDKSTLGQNDYSYYFVPIRRTGNSIAFGLYYKDATALTLNSISLRYSLRKVNFNRGTS